MTNRNEELQARRQEILESIVERMNKWDGSPESAMEILADNQPYFEELQSIENSPVEDTPSNEKETWNSLMKQNIDMRQAIQQEQQKLTHQMRQINKKDKVVEHYMKEKHPSIFVDRDL